MRDAHAAEDLFQNVVLKALTRDGLRFESPASLMSWALVTIRRESLDWIKLA
ncbi:MAG: sigma factor, partial [bacterium]